MSSFAQRCGVHDAARESAVLDVARTICESHFELVRVAWCDVHGHARSKVLVAAAAERALRSGVTMVSTLMLKDLAGHTVYKVFEPGGTESLPGFGQANNLVLLPDPTSLRRLPWAESTGWLRADLHFTDGGPVELDPRRVLLRAIERLAAAGLGMQCGLEVEFHIYRIETRPGCIDPRLDPDNTSTPGVPGCVSMVHPGANMLSEQWFDQAEVPLRIVQRTAQALGLPLLSLEAEMGPSQVEAVFDVTDALTAADNMSLFRNAVKMALQRAGYHATFMCRPPFPNIMSSGWHLHQSLVNTADGSNVFRRSAPAPGSTVLDAGHTLSALGGHYLAGLLHHAAGMTVFSTPTVNGYGRFRPNALAPQSILWGRDSRGAMLRVIGECGDQDTRIENRIGEPAANPYLYIASQIHAGLDGIAKELAPPRATDAPYGAQAQRLPSSLGEALAALAADSALVLAFGQPFVDYYSRIKRCDLQRFDEAQDKDLFHRREYFGRL